MCPISTPLCDCLSIYQLFGDILCNLKLLAAYIKHENRGIIDMKYIPRDKKTVSPKESDSLWDCFQLETESLLWNMLVYFWPLPSYRYTPENILPLYTEDNNGLSSSLCFKQPGQCAQPPTRGGGSVHFSGVCVTDSAVRSFVSSWLSCLSCVRLYNSDIPLWLFKEYYCLLILVHVSNHFVRV